MPRADHETRITPSVLDRLLDYDPQSSTEAPKSRSQSIKELKASISRDLESLLNTRRSTFYPTDGLEEASRSMIAYGLPDLGTLSPDKSSDWITLTKEIESMMAIFEPRFFDVKITLEEMDSVHRTPRFRIDAKLDIDPAPEPVSFGTSFETGIGQFYVKEV
jgi:type VI secretion system protein ImpF